MRKALGCELHCGISFFKNIEKVSPLSKINRLNIYINEGFLKESLRLFRTMPISKVKTPQELLNGLPESLPDAFPKTFPVTLLESPNPEKQLEYLSGYVNRLTKKIFRTETVRNLIFLGTTAPSKA